MIKKNNEKRLKQIFSEVLNLNANDITDNTSYEVANWDSVSHMALIAAIENHYDIMLDTNEIIDLSTFAKAKIILSNHGIKFE